MPPKRRLSETSDGTDANNPGGDDDVLEVPAVEGEEKVKAGPGRPKKKKVDPTQQVQLVFDFLRKYKKEDGTELCGSMIRLPNKRSDPGIVKKNYLIFLNIQGDP